MSDVHFKVSSLHLLNANLLGMLISANDYYLLPGATLAEMEQIPISSSEADSQYGNFGPANAHDGDTSTIYSAKDGKMATNWLKLYLSGTHTISTVKVVNRWVQGSYYGNKQKNTAVYVYEGETEVAHCGTITTLNSDYNTAAAQTYPLDCGGAVGDMIYLTDLDVTSRAGLNIAEVEVYGSGISGD